MLTNAASMALKVKPVYIVPVDYEEKYSIQNCLTAKTLNYVLKRGR